MYYGQLLIGSQTKLLRLSGNQYDLFFLPTSEYWPDGFPFPLSLNSCVICLAEENIPQHEEAILFKLLYHLFHKVVNVHPVVVHTARPENEDLYQRDEVHPSCGHYFFLYCLPSGPLSSSSLFLVAKGCHTPSETSVGHPCGDWHQWVW